MLAVILILHSPQVNNTNHNALQGYKYITYYFLCYKQNGLLYQFYETIYPIVYVLTARGYLYLGMDLILLRF